MTASTHATSPKTLARIAGLLYLVIIVCGIGGQALVREPLLADKAAQTAFNLLAAETAFRLSIVADVAMVLADVGLAVVLYVLLAPVSRALSLTAMAFRLVQASVLGLNLLNLHRAITLAQTTVIDLATRDALVTSALDAHATGYDLGLFFFAVNCLLVGMLVYRAGFLPRVLGVGIAAAGGVYLVGSTLRFVAPALAGAFAPAYAITVVAELALCLWLLVRGLDASRWPGASSDAPAGSERVALTQRAPAAA